MKNKILSITFVLFLTIMFTINILTPDNDISKTERRKLEQLPKLTINNILNKSFMEDFDSYTVDQFILRDNFRNIKANISYKVLNKIDNNKIFIYKDHIFKSEYPADEKSIDNFINKINNINNHLTKNNKVYYSIIPDKNYYIDNDKYLNINYDLLYKKTKDIKYEYIELKDILSLEDYYKTDTHWKQENLCKVVNRIGEKLNFNTNCNYTKKTYNNFYGVYYGQSALNLKPDTLTYLENENILKSKVYYLENPNQDKNQDKVYIEEYLNNLDSYDIYLSGASSYIEITNPLNKTDKELVIFRDSFSSSLAPLLIEFYSKITLIDIRYINSQSYLQKIKFDNQDILILYSTLLVNDSYTLKD